MYLGAMSCKIVIANTYTICGLENLEVKKSVHTLVNTAKLSLPLSYVVRNNNKVESVKLIDKIKESDSITIEIGYDGNNHKIFSGYIKRINNKQPLELECEDDLYWLNRIELNKSFKTTTAKQVLEFVLDECFKQTKKRIKLYSNIPQQQLTNFIVNNNGLTALKDLEKWSLHSFMINNNGVDEMYCGLLYGLKKSTVNFIINHNTINVDDLKFTQAEDNAFKVTFIYNDRKGKVHRHTFGEAIATSLGKETLHGKFEFSEIERMAKAKLEAAKTSGYKGSFLCFLKPIVEIGDIVHLKDLQFSQREGYYYVAAVTTTFGVGGGKQKIEIDFKASDK